MVVTVSHAGYIKRVPLSTYRAQRRGGKGRSGMATRGRGFRHPAVRRQHPHAGAVLLLARQGLQGEGLAPAARQRRNARGKALVNLLPLEQGERITTIMPLPEDEASWDELDVMFATALGSVRRNKLSDFVQVNRNGKIAMKLDEGDAHRRRADLHRGRRRAAHHRATASASASRSPTCASSRAAIPSACAASRLAEGDRVISMAILRHVEADARGARRLSQACAAPSRGERRGRGGRRRVERRRGGRRRRPRARRRSAIAELSAAEQFILTVSENGYGKRTSSYEFRITGRGGKGIAAMDGERAQRPAGRPPSRSSTTRSCWSPTAAS